MAATFRLRFLEAFRIEISQAKACGYRKSIDSIQRQTSNFGPVSLDLGYGTGTLVIGIAIIIIEYLEDFGGSLCEEHKR